MSNIAERALWQEVLLRQIEDALVGPAGVGRAYRISMIERARRYLTVPNRDFEQVCSLAGFDPDAVRERLSQQIADAPTPEEMCAKQSKYAANKSQATAMGARKPRRKTVKVLHNGKERTLTELADEHGIKRETLRKRLEAGWSVSRAVRAASSHVATRPGVVSNLGASQGTGGGRSAQDSPKITFSEREAS